MGNDGDWSIRLSENTVAGGFPNSLMTDGHYMAHYIGCL